MKHTVYRLSRRQTIVCLFLCAIGITLTVLGIQAGTLGESLQCLLAVPTLFLLNLMPAVVLLVLGYSLCGNLFASASVTGLVLELLSYTNLLKQEGRSDPFVPEDILLLRESMMAARDYQLNLHPLCLLVIFGSCALFVCLAIWVRTPKLRIRQRLLSGGSAVVVFLLLLLTVYPSSSYYQKLPYAATSSAQQAFSRYGFPYSFLHSFRFTVQDKPEGYRRAEVEEWEQERLPLDTAMEVNILFVMGESFSDLSDEPQFGYTQENNPIAAFHRTANSPQAVSGHIIVPNAGAGTVNTEFDVLTGMLTNLLSNHNTTAFRAVRQPVGALSEVYLAEDATGGWFLHPGASWFYRRDAVYDCFGITQQSFAEVFSSSDYDGSYVTDSAFLEKLQAGWEERTTEGQSLFAYAVTMENHQAYVRSKYVSTPDVPLNEALSLSAAAEEQLSVYFYGVKHTAEMVEQLAQYLDTLEEPTLLVFFGDHRPALGAGNLGYRESGSLAGETETIAQRCYTYQTPYLIRGNTALCERYDFSKAVEALELPEGNCIGANYLGAVVYELTGRRGTDAYWDYLTQARRILPAVHQGWYLLPDGTCTTDLDENQRAVLEKLHSWQYARLRGDTK